MAEREPDLDVLLRRAASGVRPSPEFEESLLARLEDALDGAEASAGAPAPELVVLDADDVPDDGIPVHDLVSPVEAEAPRRIGRWMGFAAAAAAAVVVTVVAISVQGASTTETANVLSPAAVARAGTLCEQDGPAVADIHALDVISGTDSSVFAVEDRLEVLAAGQLRSVVEELDDLLPRESSDQRMNELRARLDEIDRVLTTEETFFALGETDPARYSIPPLAGQIVDLLVALDEYGASACGNL